MSGPISRNSDTSSNGSVSDDIERGATGTAGGGMRDSELENSEPFPYSVEPSSFRHDSGDEENADCASGVSVNFEEVVSSPRVKMAGGPVSSPEVPSAYRSYIEGSYPSESRPPQPAASISSAVFSPVPVPTATHSSVYGSAMHTAGGPPTATTYPVHLRQAYPPQPVATGHSQIYSSQLQRGNPYLAQSHAPSYHMSHTHVPVGYAAPPQYPAGPSYNSQSAGPNRIILSSPLQPRHASLQATQNPRTAVATRAPPAVPQLMAQAIVPFDRPKTKTRTHSTQQPASKSHVDVRQLLASSPGMDSLSMQQLAGVPQVVYDVYEALPEPRRAAPQPPAETWYVSAE
eukprot:Polyplicarium_translucidae@DN3118_c0_g1_i7.p1